MFALSNTAFASMWFRNGVLGLFQLLQQGGSLLSGSWLPDAAVLVATEVLRAPTAAVAVVWTSEGDGCYLNSIPQSFGPAHSRHLLLNQPQQVEWGQKNRPQAVCVFQLLSLCLFIVVSEEYFPPSEKKKIGHFFKTGSIFSCMELVTTELQYKLFFPG